MVKVRVRGWVLFTLRVKVRVMFSEQLETLNLSFNKPSVKSL